jgi:cellulose synthase/poly-beta-1,6-N-acetylglucosamine synthase-like glycosyltransferase
MGTGMAFPWRVIKLANLASGEIVEDLKLGLELTQAGEAPLFCPSASVVSHFPSSPEGRDSQRRRWEQGHLGMIARAAPRIIFYGITRRDFALLALALDLAVPPLSLLVLIECGLLLVTAIGVSFGDSKFSLYVVGSSIVALSIAVSVGWVKFGRTVLPASEILTVPLLVLKKLGLYCGIAFGHRSPPGWVRTDRKKSK